MDSYNIQKIITNFLRNHIKASRQNLFIIILYSIITIYSVRKITRFVVF